MGNPTQPTPRDKLPTVVHGIGEETAAGPAPDSTVAKGDFVPTKLAHYKVQRKLGQGGMGWVLLAEDTQLGRRVALKVMRSKQAAEEESRKRFLREARAAAALKHDHIITIYQVGEDRGIPFLAMELLEGGSLQQRLEYPKPLSIGTAVRIAREIAEGLRHAHERGVVHRDIKPANIWLESPKGRVKILDFGLARQGDAKSGLTQAGEIVGTPHYMAPEQARGKAIDPRTDLFSLGCILYRMTTGKLPFAGETLIATLTAIAVDMPPPVQELNPLVPHALADLIGRLLAKEPSQRPASAGEVVEELSVIERDAGGTRSGFSIEVPAAIRVQVPPPPTAALPAIVTAAASVNGKTLAAQVAPLARRVQNFFAQALPRLRARGPWVLAMAAAAIAAPLVVTLVWLLRDEPAPPTRQANRSAVNHLDKPLDLRTVESLAAGSHAMSKAAAEWALASGGSASVQIKILGESSTIRISDVAGLPAEAYTLEVIELGEGSRVADEDLARLAGLTSLAGLDLGNTPIGDAGLVQLAELPALTKINLEGTKITDAGISSLARQCPNLKRLFIGRTACTADVMPHVSRLKQLDHLSLASLPIRDADLAQVQALRHLTELNLSGTKVTDAGLAVVRELPELSRLCLERTAVTDAGVATIARLGRVTALNLNGCKITDAAMGHVAQLRLDSLSIHGAEEITHSGLRCLWTMDSLKLLEVTNGQFSSAARDRLKERLPQCAVKVLDVAPDEPR